MTMRIAYAKPYGDKKTGDIEFMERRKAARLFGQDIVMPANDYESIEKEKAEKAREALRLKEEDEQEKSEILLKKKELAERNKAISKKANSRSKTIKK